MNTGLTAAQTAGTEGVRSEISEGSDTKLNRNDGNRKENR